MDTQTKNQICQSDEATPKYGFDCLPKEIVLDIASRLPIASLLRFTFVQKSFYNLSHDPQLVNLHMSRAVKKNPCIIVRANYQLFFLEFSDHGVEEEVVRKISNPLAILVEKVSNLFDDSIFGMPEFDVVGSCHGLLLCLCRVTFSNALYVFNPFTRDCKELPESVLFLEQILVYGFGFSPTTNEYKVIKVTNNNFLDHGITVVQVFTLGSDSWRSVGEVVYQIDPSSQGVMLNGKMHWLTQLEDYYGRPDRLIVSFDLADEVFGEVPKAAKFGVDPRIGQFQLAVLGGCLAVALTLLHKNGGVLVIWVMREYNVKESWVNEFVIRAFPPLPRSVTKKWNNLVKVVCMLKNGNLLLEYKDPKYRGGNLVSYDPKSGVFRALKCQGISKFRQTIVHMGCLNWIDIPSANV